MLKIKPIISTNIYFVTLLRLLLMLFIFQVSRLGFYLFNSEFFTEVTFGSYIKLAYGGFFFDLTAILYTNILYVVIMLLPTWYRHHKIYKGVAKGIFLITNIPILIANTIDYAYYPYTFRRTTALVFDEFQNESNLSSIFLQTASEFWYLSLFTLILIAAIVYGYSAIEIKRPRPLKALIYYPTTALLFLVGFGLFAGGVRGGFTYSTRPITISNATQYITNLGEEAIVLNTPFSIFRTFGEEKLPELSFYDKAELDKIYSPRHRLIQNSDTRVTTKKNIVIIVLESLGKEFIGGLNKNEDTTIYKSYAPFLDSLMTESLYFTNAYANGKISINAFGAIFSSIPSFTKPFMLSSYSQNKYGSISSILSGEGYNSMCYYGAPNGSMGFMAFSKKLGIEHYIGKDEYNNDSDYDGMWGIWDEPFLRFAASDMSKYEEPFISTIITLTSHHPFKVPTEYEGVFDKGDIPMHQVVGYTDNALREFFKTAKKQEWYDNTLFVITADHTGQTYYDKYKTPYGTYSIPLLFFTPSQELKGERTENTHQLDIMPTVLDYLQYDKPFFSFGKSVLKPSENSDFAIFYHNQNYVTLHGNYMLVFNGTKSIALYDFHNDWSLTNNILKQEPENAKKLERKTKAFLQSYNHALIHDEMTLKIKDI